VVKICAFCSGEYENDDDPDLCCSDCSKAFWRVSLEEWFGYVTVMKQPSKEAKE
jgi:hypothetical protein